MGKTYSYPGYKDQHKQSDPDFRSTGIPSSFFQAMGIDLAKEADQTKVMMINMGGQRAGKTLAMLEAQNLEQAGLIVKIRVENEAMEQVIQGMQIQLADMNAATKSLHSALNKRDAEIKRLNERPKPYRVEKPGRNIIV